MLETSRSLLPSVMSHGCRHLFLQKKSDFKSSWQEVYWNWSELELIRNSVFGPLSRRRWPLTVIPPQILKFSLCRFSCCSDPFFFRSTCGTNFWKFAYQSEITDAQAHRSDEGFLKWLPESSRLQQSQHENVKFPLCRIWIVQRWWGHLDRSSFHAAESHCGLTCHCITSCSQETYTCDINNSSN